MKLDQIFLVELVSMKMILSVKMTLFHIKERPGRVQCATGPLTNY